MCGWVGTEYGLTWGWTEGEWKEVVVFIWRGSVVAGCG